MQKNISERKRFQRKVIGFYALFFLIIILSSNTELQDKALKISDKVFCSIKKGNANSLINVNEMPFSIKSFSLYDSEDTNNH